jgi:ammonia channel protein AmtB
MLSNQLIARGYWEFYDLKLANAANVQFLQPFLSRRLGIHDTCGVNNLHGMPGILSGLGGIICAALASAEVYGEA